MINTALGWRAYFITDFSVVEQVHINKWLHFYYEFPQKGGFFCSEFRNVLKLFTVASLSRDDTDEICTLCFYKQLMVVLENSIS